VTVFYATTDIVAGSSMGVNVPVNRHDLPTADGQDQIQDRSG
jgi:hypothetical protein